MPIPLSAAQSDLPWAPCRERTRHAKHPQGKRMTDHDRLTQLRVLLERLERMPASPDRDWMPAGVPSRAVDIDTGIAPRPMRPLEGGMTLEAEATPVRPAKKKPQPAAQ